MASKDEEVTQDELKRVPDDLFEPPGEKGTERVDHHGFKLVPQPSRFKDDPLVGKLKHIDMVLVSLTWFLIRTGRSG
jgi:hypothetical protein